ncbi:MAG: protein kinase, partial [Gemmatimonadales bacterium]
MAETKLNFCAQCGTELAEGVRFCASCGFDISQGTKAATATPPQPAKRAIEDVIADQLKESLVGEYDIYGMLGKGGMAIVYRAHEMMLDREVAIKVLPPEMAFGSGMVERFKREAKTSAKLNHPNIIPIYRIGELEGTVYFVMKYVPGKGLDEILKVVGRLSPEMTAAVIEQVGNALQYAHKQDVIHRDIKPSNIMIDEAGWSLVMDFGIAKAGGSQTLTATGAAIGTPHYMSPEQCSGKDVTYRSDQYSLGVMTYQMLTGILPFDGETLPEIISKHFFEEPTPITELWPGCPVPLSQAVAKAIAKKPDDRYPNMEAFVQAVKASVAYDAHTAGKQLAEIVQGEGSFEALPPLSPVPTNKSGTDAPTTPMPRQRGARPSAPTTPMPVQKEPVPSHAAATALAPATATPVADEATTPIPATSQPKKKGKGGLIAAVLGLLVVGAAAAFFVMGGPARFFGAAAATTASTGTPFASTTGGGQPSTPADGGAGGGGGGGDTPADGDTPTQQTDSPAAVADTATPEPTQRTTPSRTQTQQPRPQPQRTQPRRNTPTPPPNPDPGVLRFLNAPSGSRMLVDGVLVSNPLRHQLPPGSHTVIVVAAGYERFTMQVTIRSNAPTTIDLSIMTPTGAQPNIVTPPTPQ